MIFDPKNTVRILVASASALALTAGMSAAQDRHERDDANLNERSDSVIENPVRNSTTVEKGDFSRAGRDRSALTDPTAPMPEEGVAIENIRNASPEAIAFADVDDDGYISAAEMETLEVAAYALKDGHVEATKLAVTPLGFGTAHADDLVEADANDDGLLTVAELESLRDSLQQQTKVQ